MLFTVKTSERERKREKKVIANVISEAYFYTLHRRLVMASRKLVTVVGATGAQGGAVVKALAETGKYKVIFIVYKLL
jgi:hypothetical protein